MLWSINSFCLFIYLFLLHLRVLTHFPLHIILHFNIVKFSIKKRKQIKQCFSYILLISNLEVIVFNLHAGHELLCWLVTTSHARRECLLVSSVNQTIVCLIHVVTPSCFLFQAFVFGNFIVVQLFKLIDELSLYSYFLIMHFAQHIQCYNFDDLSFIYL